jgi:hypothetical protein
MANPPIAATRTPPSAPQLFLLRVWRDGHGVFHAALRPVGGTEPGRVFTQPAQVGEFLRRRASALPSREDDT